MRRSARFLTLITAMVLPAAAFVFVPSRGGVQPRWQSAATVMASDAIMTADVAGDLFVVEATHLRALAADDGATLWTWPAPDGYRLVDSAQAGTGLVVAVARRQDTPTQVQIVALDTRLDAGGAPHVRWEQRGTAVSPEGVRLLPADPARHEPEHVAVLSDGSLLLLNAGTGAVMARKELGQFAGRPAWFGRRGAVPVLPPATWRESGAVAVCAFEASTAPAERTTRLLALPAGEAVTGMDLGAHGSTLLVRGRAATYAFAFVFVADRNPGRSRLIELGHADQPLWADAPDGNVVYLGGPAELRAVDPDTGAVRWALAAPEGRRWVAPLRAVAGGLAVAAAPLEADEPAWLMALSAEAAGAQPRRLWQVQDVLPGAWHVDQDAVAVVADGELVVRDFATGGVRARRRLGRVAGPLIWAGDSGFAVTSDGYLPDDGGPPGPAVVGFDILAAGTPNDAAESWIWPLPAGETVDRLDWLPGGPMLLVHGEHGTYAFP